MGARLVRGGRPRDAGAGLIPQPWWFGPAVIDPAAPGAPFDLVLLDRDGTLNVRVEDGYVTHPEELVLLPGAARAVGRITAAGCRTVLVTNQRGVARGRMTGDDLESVHGYLTEELARGGGRLDAIAVCPHEEGECACRKPRDGLFRAALARAPWARAGRCLMIGDMPTDLAPAAGLGMRTTRVGEDAGIAVVVDRLLGSTTPGDERPDVNGGEGHVF